MAQCSSLTPALDNLMIILAWQTLLVRRGAGDFVSFPVYTVVFLAGRCYFELEKVFAWIVFLPVYWGLPKADGRSLTTVGSSGLLAILAW